MKIKDKKTGEKFLVVSYNQIFGFAVGGTYTISNIKTKEIKMITGFKFKRRYEVISE